jgi:hypothetical protein
MRTVKNVKRWPKRNAKRKGAMPGTAWISCGAHPGQSLIVRGFSFNQRLQDRWRRHWQSDMGYTGFTAGA